MISINFLFSSQVKTLGNHKSINHTKNGINLTKTLIILIREKSSTCRISDRAWSSKRFSVTDVNIRANLKKKIMIVVY